MGGGLGLFTQSTLNFKIAKVAKAYFFMLTLKCVTRLMMDYPDRLVTSMH